MIILLALLVVFLRLPARKIANFLQLRSVLQLLNFYVSYTNVCSVVYIAFNIGHFRERSFITKGGVAIWVQNAPDLILKDTNILQGHAPRSPEIKWVS